MGKDTGLINYDVFYKGSHARNNEQLLKECKSELELHYKETKAILLENIEILNEIAETLIEVETIDEENLRRIMEKHQSAKVITV